MIDKRTFTKEHFDSLKNNNKVNPAILERTLFALGLVEALRKAGMDFIFKGGSSLMIILDNPMRLSTDIDIIVEPNYEIDTFIEKASKIFPFKRKEESVRKTNKDISKRHFKFYFQSIERDDEDFSVLLDVVYEKNPYPVLIEKEIKNTLLINAGKPLKVKTPSINSIAGDKLTAFAPHTIGVNFFYNNFSNDKRLEVIKQFYDVSTLFDHITNYNEVKRSYIEVTKHEIEYRKLDINYKSCLLDTYRSALTILLRKENDDGDYANFVEGMKRISGHIYGESFSSEVGRLHASKVMLLSACLYKDIDILGIDLNDAYAFQSNDLRIIKSFKRGEKTLSFYLFAAYAMMLMSN